MRIRRPEGVTLLELLIGIGVLSVVVLASFSVYHWIAKAERESSVRHTMEDLRLEVMRWAFSENALELAITPREDGLSALNVNLAKCLIEEINPPLSLCPATRFPIMLFSKFGRLSGFGAEAPSPAARVLYRRDGSICPVGAQNDESCVIELTSTARCIDPDCRANEVDRVRKLEISVKIEWTQPIPGVVLSPLELTQPVTLQPAGPKGVVHISATAEVPNVLATIVIPTPTFAAVVAPKRPVATLAPTGFALSSEPTPLIIPTSTPYETPMPSGFKFVLKPTPTITPTITPIPVDLPVVLQPTPTITPMATLVIKPEAFKPVEDRECSVELRPFGGGAGSKENPYKICSPAQLQNIQEFLTASFELTRDINLTGFAIRPIGEKRGAFTGVFNGRKHVIRNLTLVDSIESEPLGLFSKIGTKALIQNLSMIDASISNQNALAKNRCMGILAGSIEGGATLEQVQTNGRLSSGAGESVIAGGIAGCAQDVSLKNSRFSGEFDRFTIKSSSIVAGGFGILGGKSLLSNLNIQLESMDARSNSKLKVAALVGEIRSSEVTIRRSWVRNATHHAVVGFGSCVGIDAKRFTDIYVEFTTDETVKASPACPGEVRLYSCPDSQHLKPKANCEGPLHRWKEEFKLPAYCPEKACWPSDSL